MAIQPACNSAAEARASRPIARLRPFIAMPVFCLIASIASVRNVY
jgi:hypothetical protein